MTISEINKKIKELSDSEEQIKRSKKQRELKLYEQLIIPLLKEYDKQILDINRKKAALCEVKKRYYESYIFDNEYIGKILARLLTECTKDNYKYYKRICFYCSLYGPNYAEERFCSSIISCFTPKENLFGKVEESKFYERNLNSLICFKESEVKERGYQLDRNWNPGYIVLDLYASEKIVFKHRGNCCSNDTPQRIFETPYGEFIKELAERRFTHGEISDKEVDNMVKSFVSKSKEKQKIKK